MKAPAATNKRKKKPPAATNQMKKARAATNQKKAPAAMHKTKIKPAATNQIKKAPAATGQPKKAPVATGHVPPGSGPSHIIYGIHVSMTYIRTFGPVPPFSSPVGSWIRTSTAHNMQGCQPCITSCQPCITSCNTCSWLFLLSFVVCNLS